MSREVHVLYTVDRDETGTWCASAQLRHGVGAVGDGETKAAAIADLREALLALIDEVGPPPELTLHPRRRLMPQTGRTRTGQ